MDFFLYPEHNIIYYYISVITFYKFTSIEKKKDDFLFYENF